MLFDSGVFALFISVFILVYYNIGSRLQTPWLLFGSLVFYMWSDPILVFVPLLIIGVSYFIGEKIEAVAAEKRKEKLLAIGVVLLVSLLVFYKYTGFLIRSVLELFGLIGVLLKENQTNTQSGFFTSLVVPLGISYIVFQSIGYLIEIKREKLSAERDLIKLSTYLLFFPKTVAGPVERAEHFLPQLSKPLSFKYELVTTGIRQFGWGLFKKLVIADRLAFFVNYVYGDLHAAQGFSIAIAFFLFPLQLYADFSGYTDMALGLAKMLGYDLTGNFNRPFSSKSMVEFWRRWHISLSTWFNEYFYTPIAIKRRDWGKWSMVYASMLTFLLLGLWHGPSWTFIFFGAINGLFIAAEFLTARSRKNIRKNIPENANTIGGVVYVYFAFGLACIFFRALNVSDAFYFLAHLFSTNSSWIAFKATLQSTGLGFIDYLICFITIPLMFYVERKGFVTKVTTAPQWIRWSVYYVFLTVVVVYGISSGAGFIYKQF